MMPNGLNMKYGTVFSEGNNVSVQCESNTTAANGRKYSNLYHFYVKFDGDKHRAGARVLRHQSRARGFHVPARMIFPVASTLGRLRIR